MSLAVARCVTFLALLNSLSSVFAQSTTPSSAVLTGMIRSSDTQDVVDHPVTLVVMCTQGRGGALSLQLRIPQGSAVHFNFDPFEGPGAPASRQQSAHLAVDNDAAASFAVAGWWDENENSGSPLSFVFGIATSQRRADELAPIVSAMTRPDATLLWTQDGAASHGQSMRARFIANAAQRRRIIAVASPCLVGHREKSP